MSERIEVTGPEARVFIKEPEEGAPVDRVLLSCGGVDYDVFTWRREQRGIPILVRAEPKYEDGSGCAYEGYVDNDPAYAHRIELRIHPRGGLMRLHVSLRSQVYEPPPPPGPPDRAELVASERAARELLAELQPPPKGPT